MPCILYEAPISHLLLIIIHPLPPSYLLPFTFIFLSLVRMCDPIDSVRAPYRCMKDSL